MDCIGLDIGRRGVKAVCGMKMFTFPSIVGEWRERKLVTDYGDNGFTVEINGQRYFVGVLAQYESNYWRYMMTDDKVHDDTLILALSAIHRAGLSDVTVVTGLPVKYHDAANKDAMKRLLLGNHTGRWDVTINGDRRIIRIHDVKVAVEGGAAFWSSPQDGLIRLIDAGSKTVNCVTMRDKRYNDRESRTLNFGWNTGSINSDDDETIQSADFARRIAGEVGKLSWRSDNVVTVSGGRARELAEALKPHFPLSVPVNNALYANAIGFYRAGRASL
jgi:plasmid segregation protein ParM